MPASSASGPPIISSLRTRRLRLGLGCGTSTVPSVMGLDPSGMVVLLHLAWLGRGSCALAAGKVGAHPGQEAGELVPLILADAGEGDFPRLRAQRAQLLQQWMRPLSQEQQTRPPVAWIRPPFDEAARFEAIDDARQGDRLDIEQVCQR